MEEKYSAVYDLLISDSAENCVNKLADINIFITGEIRNKEMDPATIQYYFNTRERCREL